MQSLSGDDGTAVKLAVRGAGQEYLCFVIAHARIFFPRLRVR